jgi:uncharacterized protein
MRFEWDLSKDRANLKKHGLSFEDVLSVFKDPHILTQYDDEHSTLDEDRWLSLGSTKHGLICVVISTDRSNQHEKILRLISARKADAQEQMEYYSNHDI